MPNEGIKVQKGASDAASSLRWCACLTLAVAAGVLLWNFWHYARGADCAITLPFGLDYGEGIVWQQMRRIVTGTAYGPIEGFPAIVFHYPPMYHLGAAFIAATTGLDELAAGRTLSIGSTVVMAGFLGLIVDRLSGCHGQRAPGLVAGLLTALIVFTLLPVQLWSYLMRVDMPSFALSFAGFYFGLRALSQPRAIHIAAVLFVMAIYTKQTAIAAPASVFAVLLVLRPRTAWYGIATTLATGLVALGALTWLTGGGFLRHVLFYNINRIDPAGWDEIGKMLNSHGLYAGVALAGVVFVLTDLTPKRDGWRTTYAQLRASPPLAGQAMALLYLVITTLMLLMALKSGASYNYFIEWCCLLALFVGLQLAGAAGLALGEPRAATSKVLLALLPAVVAYQAHTLGAIAALRCHSELRNSPESARLAALVRAAPGPVIADDMIAVLRGGKDVIWEPAIFAELASAGVWDERHFVAKIKAGDFAFFVTDGEPGQSIFDDRYSPAIANAIRAAYPVERRLAGRHIRFPAGPLPTYAADLD